MASGARQNWATISWIGEEFGAIPTIEARIIVSVNAGVDVFRGDWRKLWLHKKICESLIMFHVEHVVAHLHVVG